MYANTVRVEPSDLNLLAPDYKTDCSTETLFASVSENNNKTDDDQYRNSDGNGFLRDLVIWDSTSPKQIERQFTSRRPINSGNGRQYEFMTLMSICCSLQYRVLTNSSIAREN